MKRILALMLLFTSGLIAQNEGYLTWTFPLQLWRDSAGVIVPVPAGKSVVISSLSLSTINGNVTFTGNASVNGTFTADTVNGSIVFTGPIAVNGTLTADTLVGSIVATSITAAGPTGTFDWWTRGTAPNSGTVRTSTTTDTVRAGALIVDGNSGFGTTNPDHIVDISAATGTQQIISTTGTNIVYTRYSNSGGDFFMGRESSTGASLLPGSSTYAGVLSVEGAYSLQFGTNLIARMTIDSSGNVGIGITAPRSKLDFGAANVAQIINLAESGNVRTGFGMDSSTASMRLFIPDASDQFFAFGTVALSNGSTWAEKVRIQSNGNVGIGTTGPSVKLNIVGSGWTAGSSAGDLLLSGSGIYGEALTLLATDTGGRKWSLFSTGSANSGGAGNFAIFDETISQYRVLINSTGNVGIGTTTALTKLDVTGTARSTDTLRVGTWATGSWIKPGDAAWTVVSDVNKKENIRDYAGLDLSKFSQVKPKVFRFKENLFYRDFDESSLSDTLTAAEKAEKRAKFLADNRAEAARLNAIDHLGFIAQDFNKLFPDRTKLTIDYAEVLGVMWLKIAELEARIKAGGL